MALMADANDTPEAYMPFDDGVMSASRENASQVPTRPGDIVQAIWCAVTDPACPLHVPAGSDAEALAA